MEVSHATSETQAVAIGINGKAEEVTVSTDAEFMMTIAHGIYSNKALALVRELLCNARDGHAKAGCMEKPIIVTLTDNLLVVRDQGTGIPNPIFAPTYMTFGKSTKRKEANQTGGFGVGTKVPWAVCDVFSARNFIDGTMTAYSIVKSDPNMEGKPTCTPVMCIPSTEQSGVEVSVPFPEKMHSDIHKYLLLFSKELGIPIELNEQEVVQRDHFANEELAKFGFARLPEHPKTVIQPSPFYVRQGDVIYPIEVQDEFQDAFELLGLLNTGSHNTPLLFMAEPDSIIPTLSRESLQYTDRTSKSIRDLMKKALKGLADNVDAYTERTARLFPKYLTESAGDFVQAMWANRFEPAEHIARAHQLNLRDRDLSETQNYLLMNNMVRWLTARTPYLETPTITGQQFRLNLTATLETAFKAKLARYDYYDQERLIEIWEENKKCYNRKADFPRKLIRNVYEEVMFWRAEANSTPDIVEVYLPKDDDLRFAANGNRIAGCFLEVLQIKDLDVKKEAMFNHYQDFLKQTLYVSNTVVISTTPASMVQRCIEKFEKQPHGNVFVPYGPGRLAGARCVRVRATIKPTEVETLKKRFEGYGYSVLVLLDPTRAELEERRIAAEERAALKAIPLPMLDELIRDNIPQHPFVEGKIKRRQLNGLKNSPEFKGEPLFFILPRGKDLPYNMKTMGDYVRLVRFVGTDIHAVSTKSEIARMIKEGRRNLEDALLELAQWFYKKPGIHEKLYYQGTFFVSRAKQNKYLTKLLFNRVPPVMDAEEERIYKGLHELSSLFPSLATYLRGRDAYYAHVCTPSRHYEDVFRRYAQANFCDVHRAIEKAYSERPSPKRALARSILKTILKKERHDR